MTGPSSPGVHQGPTPADCPVCKPQHRVAVRLLSSKPHKVYGRVTRNGRRDHGAAQRDARAMFDRLFRDHQAGLKSAADSAERTT